MSTQHARTTDASRSSPMACHCGVVPSLQSTLRLSPAGLPRRAGGRTAGAALLTARRAKERTYPELCRSNRCRLTVIALEIGGRWSAEAATFVRLLARCRARSAPPASRAAAISAFTLRWSALLSFAAARSFAASLLSLPLTGTANVDGELPPLSDILRRLASPATACQPCGVKATAFAFLSRRLLPWLWACALGPRCSDVGNKVRGEKKFKGVKIALTTWRRPRSRGICTLLLQTRRLHRDSYS